MSKQARQKFVQLAKADLLRYESELQQLTLGFDEKPQEPIRARTPYMFFVREAREYVSRDLKHIQKRDIMLEVGKLWNSIKQGMPTPGVSVMSYYENLAKQDLVRFKQEHAAYVQKINSMRHSNIVGK